MQVRRKVLQRDRQPVRERVFGAVEHLVRAGDTAQASSGEEVAVADLVLTMVTGAGADDRLRHVELYVSAYGVVVDGYDDEPDEPLGFAQLRNGGGQPSTQSRLSEEIGQELSFLDA
jgi:hypothetical protein